jgi:alkylhydroperoxidase family enzyme
MVTARVTATGPPAIFTTLGRHPRLFRGWLLYSAHLMPFGTLPRPDAELVILRVAWVCDAAYEWWQHVPLALRAGLLPNEIETVADVAPTDGLSDRRRVLVAVTDELLAHREMSDETWRAAGQTLSDREVIELCLLIGHYQGLATAIGGLGVQVEHRA